LVGPVADRARVRALLLRATLLWLRRDAAEPLAAARAPEDLKPVFAARGEAGLAVGICDVVSLLAAGRGGG
jgi:hypothetical protein